MDIINLSLGSTSGSITLKNACSKAELAGILVVAAAGNSGKTGSTADCVIYPAKYDSVVAVGAVDNSLTRAGFSSTGPAVEIAAPECPYIQPIKIMLTLR
jgi:subtilisin family serine protease